MPKGEYAENTSLYIWFGLLVATSSILVDTVILLSAAIAVVMLILSTILNAKSRDNTLFIFLII